MNKYKWAMNDLKLDLAKKDAEFQKQLNPNFQVNEESIKAFYIKRGGLVIDEDIEIIDTTPEPVKIGTGKIAVESRKLDGGGTAKKIVRRK